MLSIFYTRQRQISFHIVDFEKNNAFCLTADSKHKLLTILFSVLLSSIINLGQEKEPIEFEPNFYQDYGLIIIPRKPFSSGGIEVHNCSKKNKLFNYF